MRAEIREIVEDPQRQENVVALVDELQVQYSTLRQTAATRRKAIQTLNADYDATREQFAELLDRHNAEMESSHKAYLKSYRALVEATTAEEWSALAKSSTKAMRQLAQSVSSI